MNIKKNGLIIILDANVFIEVVNTILANKSAASISEKSWQYFLIEPLQMAPNLDNILGSMLISSSW